MASQNQQFKQKNQLVASLGSGSGHWIPIRQVPAGLKIRAWSNEGASEKHRLVLAAAMNIDQIFGWRRPLGKHTGRKSVKPNICLSSQAGFRSLATQGSFETRINRDLMGKISSHGHLDRGLVAGRAKRNVLSSKSGIGQSADSRPRCSTFW